MNINQMFIGITKQVHMFSYHKYLNKAIKNEAVTTIQNVSLLSKNTLILTRFHFLNSEFTKKQYVLWKTVIN